MPGTSQLPPDLADLAFRNAVELTHARWDSDVEVLARALEPHVNGRPPDEHARPTGATVTPPAAKARWPWIATLLALVVVAGGWFAYDRQRQAAATTGPERQAAADKSPSQVVTFQGRVAAQDPCNGRRFRTTGTTTLTIARNSQGGVLVQQQYDGSGAGYTVRISGSQRFDRPATSYDISIRGEWTGPGGSRFETQTVDRITTDANGRPGGDSYQSETSRCLSQ